MKLFILLLISFLYAFANDNKLDIFINPQKLKLIYISNDNLYDPEDFIIQYDKIVVLDHKGDYPLKFFDEKNGHFLGNIARKGYGPGEIISNGPISIRENNNFIYVYGTNKILNIYEYSSNTYKFLKYIIPDKLYYEFCVTDSLFIFRGGLKRNFLFYFYKKHTNKESILDKELFHDVKFNGNKFLEPCYYNSLINQGKFYYNSNKLICYFDYSTLILVYDIINKREKYIFDPEKILLPKTEKKHKKRLWAPDATKYKQTYLDITSDSKYYYLLYSGFKPSILSFLSNSEEILQGNILRIFDKNSFKYLGSIILPEYAKRAKIKDNNLYLLSIQNEPHISKYKFKISIIK